MQKNLFAYGTLMCEDLMHEVSTLHSNGEPATLNGFSRRAVIGQPYPALIELQGESVDGVLYRDIPDDCWPRLDRFETVAYARRAVTVQLATGQCVDAEVYVVEDDYRDTVSDKPWDFQQFLDKGRQEFSSRYVGYGEL